MRKLQRAMLLLLIVCMLLGSGLMSVGAAQEGNVYDGAELLTDDERSALDESISEFMEESGWNIYAVTTMDAQGKSATAYADDFFDALSPEQEDGIVFLIDMDNREIAISTCGAAIRYLTDQRIDSILDDAYAEVSDGSYAACFDVMLSGALRYYREGIPSGQYNYDTETGEISVYRSLTAGEILVAVLAALCAGGAVYAIVIGKYRLSFGSYKYEFRENGSVSLRVKEDRFIHETTTHRRIPKQTNNVSSGSSGRSSTHSSSSGRSHGGGSRKF